MKKNLFAVAACAALASSLVSCGGSGGGGSPSPSPSPSGVSISGTVSSIPTAAVDSDTNDPLQQGRAGNNNAGTAQALGNPATVVGYVNKPNTGPDGPNRAGGDEFDGFQVSLAANQVVVLTFGDETVADLDLRVYNSTGTTLLQISRGTNRSECIRIGTTGSYQVVVEAFSGASTYQLSWGPASLGTTCPLSTLSNSFEPAFIAGELLAKPKPGTAAETARAALAAAQIEVMPAADASLPHLLRLPADAAQRARALATLAAHSDKRIAAATQSAATQSAAAPEYGLSDQARRAADTATALKRLRASGQYEYVEYNLVMQAYQTAFGAWPPNDTDLARMPHLDKIHLPDAFNALNATRPAYQPIVAVIDTGIVADHPDLTRMVIAGFDFVSDPNSAGDGGGIDADPNDAAPNSPNNAFHGTHVAGTIAAETFNGTGIVGVAPMARIMPLRVLGVNGSGTLNDILQAIRYAARLSNSSGFLPAKAADVINMSLGGGGSCPQAYRDTITSARDAGVIIVAATGNETSPVGMPANCPGVIAVSAISYSGQIAPYSNTGPEVVVTAPGGDFSRRAVNGTDEIWSASATFINNVRTPNYVGLQGTSMATPHVAGVMALMRAVNPTITPSQIDTMFANGQLTDDVGAAGRDNLFGYGLINAMKAITAAGGTQPPPQDLPTLQLSTNRLDFGDTTTTLPITLTRINSSTDSPNTYRHSASNANAVVVTAQGGNPPNGPYVLNVTISRGQLLNGEDNIQVEFTSIQNKILRFDVVVAPRAAPNVGLLGVGPVYVLALNPSNLDTLAQANVTTNARSYAYSISNVTAGSVVVVAGTDTDNDGLICGLGEPCGAYPVLGSELTAISLTGNRTGINFSLDSGISISTLPAVPSQTRRGFARLK